MNSLAIAAAIAARFVDITATNGTATETVSATARLPNSIAKGPVLLVYHPIGTLEYHPSKQRGGHLTYPVRLLRDPIDVPNRSDWLHAWFDALIDEVGKATTLGGLVEQALPSALRVELDGQTYASMGGASATFDVVELLIDVTTFEVVTSQQP